MAVTKAWVTAEQLLGMRRDPLNRFELVSGALVKMTPVGGEHGEVAARFAARLLDHVERRRLGRAGVEIGYRLTRDPDTVRGPDVSFVSASRLPGGRLPRGYVDGAPDLAVEVVSPDDTADEIAVKVQEYFAHGCRLVLVVHPRPRTVTAYHPDGTARVLRSGDAIDGGDVVPGFALPVDELFGA